MSSQLGNIISRLQGLKNVSGRRVMPGQEFMQQMEPEPLDVSGAGAPEPIAPPMNQPQQDRGGMVTPQSYDVRANVAGPIAPPEMAAPVNPPDPGMLAKFGSALANVIARPGLENDNPMLASGVEAPQMGNAAQPPREESSFMSGLASGLSSVPQSNFIAGLGDGFSSVPQSNFIAGLGDGFSFKRFQLPSQQAEQENQRVLSQAALDQKIAQAAQNPWQNAVYGSAQEVANHPALQAEFKKLSGIDFTPVVAAQVSKYEEAMKGVEDRLNGLNAQLDPVAEQIAQRIMNNQSTEADALYVGMALAMPLLLGGFFGKEVGLGALAGGAKGFADVLGQRQDNIRKDEANLLDVNNQQAGIQDKLAGIQADKAKYQAALESNLPADPNAPFLGMEQATWVDPETGKEVSGIKVLPGFVARKEKMNTEKDKERMEKAASELAEIKTFVDNVNDVTDRISQILPQIKDKNFAWKGLKSYLANKDPSILAKLSQDITLDGKKINAGLALEQEFGFLSNLYAHSQDLGQLDRAAQSHMVKLFQNPEKSFSRPEDAMHEIINVRNLAQKGLVNSAKNHGFVPEFVLQEMETSNKPFNQKLNKRENTKRVNDLVRDASKNEVTYAK